MFCAEVVCTVLVSKTRLVARSSRILGLLWVSLSSAAFPYRFFGSAK